MSHLKERKEKICLNCQAELNGRFCHVCGQENLEPKETVWHLVQHFFNDVTHFDGKFFETVKFLLRKPGFLSLEYMRGRRASYLNPIRMYVFTSAIFFIVFFSLKKPEDRVKANGKITAEQQVKDSLKRKQVFDDLAKQGIQMPNRDSIEKTIRDSRDTIKNYRYKGKEDEAKDDDDDDRKDKEKDKAEKSNFWDMGSFSYATTEEYDSAERALPDSLRDGWLKRAGMHRAIVLKEEYHADKKGFQVHLMEHIFHTFPKILFVSLPLFAMILNILYFRHKQYYYVNHGIFTIHVYCATFILLLINLLLGQLEDAVHAEWLRTVIGTLMFVVGLYMLIYLYKAMRGFYKQGRGKTFLKYFIVCSVATIVNLIIFLIFLLITVISI